MLKNTQSASGFTLVELLLVIAIIGVLASVVLSSLRDARDSGNDAVIKQSLANVRAHSNVFYNQNNFSYDDGTNAFCDSTEVQTVFTGIEDANGGVAPECNDSTGAWAASSVMFTSTTTYWCVDSNGTVGETSSALGSGEVCS